MYIKTEEADTPGARTEYRICSSAQTTQERYKKKSTRDIRRKKNEVTVYIYMYAYIYIINKYK